MTEAGNQTYSTVASFSPLTCHELIDRLNPQQLDRELKLIFDPNVGIPPSNPKKMKAALKTHFNAKIKVHNAQLVDSIHELTTKFSRDVTRAGEDMEKLHDAISNTHDVLTSFQPGATAPPSSPPPETAHNSGTSGITGTVLRPFYKFDDTPFVDFDLHTLDDDTVYDKTFANRKVAYYGDFPYSYSGGSHAPRDIKDNPTLQFMSVAVQKFCEEQGVDFTEFNSAMITKYDSHQSCIPPHSDDEPSIAPGSVILTVSLGATRQLVFRRKPPGAYCDEFLEVGQGDVYIMTRHSQDFFDHWLPKMSREDVTGPRISVTFRALTPSGTGHDLAPRPCPFPSNMRQPVNSKQPAPTVRRAFNSPRKQVLILSDSKNKSFDCTLFKDPVDAFRKDLFFLRDLSKHSDDIARADVVLISAGVNDIMKNKVDARILHDHLKNFISRFDKTQFLFDSICPVSMNTDRFNRVNDCINNTNEYLLKFSIRTDNLRLFDNLCFGLPHLSRDGIHLNFAGKTALSNCWVNATLIRLGLKRGYLPLRQNFLRIVHEFYAEKG